MVMVDEIQLLQRLEGEVTKLRCFPFSFAEYMSAKKITSDYDVKAVNDYMQFGGLPQTTAPCKTESTESRQRASTRR
jgi:predicted AAA+ superfamily ATPase